MQSIDMVQLVKGKPGANIAFMQWLKGYCESLRPPMKPFIAQTKASKTYLRYRQNPSER